MRGQGRVRARGRVQRTGKVRALLPVRRLRFFTGRRHLGARPGSGSGSPLPGDASAAPPGRQRSGARFIPRRDCGNQGSGLVLHWNRWARTKSGAEGTTFAQGNGRRVQPRGRGGARGRGNAAPHWPLCLGSSAAPSRTMENYHVLEMIGEGSFGRVYKGRRKHSAQVRGEDWG